MEGVDVDVDLGALFEAANDDALIDIGWYELVQQRSDRSPKLQAKLDELLRKRMLAAQWNMSKARRIDRRAALRVPMLARVAVDDSENLTSCNISESGIQCCGDVTAPVMDIEFSIPTLEFPVCTSVECVRFEASNVYPMVGMRFVRLESVYQEAILEYVSRKRPLRQAA